MTDRKQAPVAWITKGGKGDLWWHRSVDENGNDNLDDVPLYMGPPKNLWIGLTDEEINAIPDGEYMDFYKSIEAKLKEKNT